METGAKNVKSKRAQHGAKGDPSITYTPRADATQEGELAALAAVYHFLLLHSHVTSEDEVAEGVEGTDERAE